MVLGLVMVQFAGRVVSVEERISVTVTVDSTALEVLF